MKTLFPFLIAILFSCSDSSDASTDGQIIDDQDDTIETPVEVVNVTQPEVSQYAGYTLIWNDEFNQSSLDAAKWNFETGTGINGDFGTGQLDRATDRVENVSMLPGTGSDGSLVIATRKETYLDRNYTSGRINTKDKFSCGPGTRIEARVWAKDVKYKGQGFAFWMMPAEIPSGEDHLMWPQGGEVDIMEYVGAIPFHNLGTVHYAWSWENNQYQDWNHGHKGGYYSYEETQVPAANPVYGNWPPAAGNTNAGSAGYHLYRVDWFSDRIEFSVDEVVYHVNYFNDGAAFNNAPDGQDADNKIQINGKRTFVSEYSHHFTQWAPFSHNFYLILSAGVGGNDNMSYGGAIVPEAVFPCQTLVDYVRVYQRN
ncbi:glycoside hydrolase family 16 protein [Flavobacterium silvaticum]|uniref:Glycoside hydrolase family 16 protein n=1 Tax=Flavobacterium silvaticum TaxID=1852020 RepID=A0A972FSZ3_9FLAO|nr:glycoside hydrolase family 16 protein [Flavobacterium silvaticum]NMH26975.1 glycoside hydrolase family 16 protein [Flavobacterium silvaticum]